MFNGSQMFTFDKVQKSCLKTDLLYSNIFHNEINAISMFLKDDFRKHERMNFKQLIMFFL